MSILILRGLLLTLEALAISALLPLLAWATGLFIRKNAAMRHLVWLATFGVLLALPLLALILPPQTLVLQPAPPVPVDVVMAAPVTASYVDHWSIESIIAVAAAPLCALWLAGVAWNLLRLALGAHGLVRMRRASTAFDRIAGCDVRLGGGPLTFGWLKPVIILPKDAPHWSRERLDAVLKHELAHIARHDSVTQWLAALACAFYWPNPLMWMGAKTLRRDAEMAADDRVLAAGVQPSLYAAELVRLAADAKGAPRLALAMATPSSLEARVTSVLSPTPSRAGVTPMTALKLGLLGGACAVALAFARPDIAMAQAPVTSAPLPAPADVATPATAATPATPTIRHRAHNSNVNVDVDVDHDGDQEVTDATISTEKDGVKMERHFHHDGHMTPEQRAEFRKAMADMKVELANIHPQIEKALAQAKVAREQAMAQAHVAREQALAQAQVARANAHVASEAWHQAASEINEAVRQAMDEIRPYIREASRDPNAGEKIGQKVNEAMARVQPRIDAAIARANAVPRAMPHPEVAPLPPVPPVAPMPAPPPAPPPPVQ